MKYLFYILLCLITPANAQIDSLNEWIKKQGNKLDAHDHHFRELYAQMTPENWLDDVNSRFTNGYNVALVDVDNFFVSACKYHSCDEKVVFWYNTVAQKGLLVVIDVAYPAGEPSPLYYISKSMSKLEIPQKFHDTFNNWLIKEKIKVGSVEYYMAETTNKSTSGSVEIDSLYKYSLSCFKAGKKEMAITTLEHTISAYNLSIDTTTVALFNDLAYFFEQTKQFASAEPLLLAITERFPDRTVAWLNLGDTQLGLGKRVDAMNAFNRYIDLMKASGKDGKIPKRVNDFLKTINSK